MHADWRGCPAQGIRVKGQPWRGALNIVELMCCQRELHAMRSSSLLSSGEADGFAGAGSARALSLNLQTGVLSTWDSSRQSRVRPDQKLPAWA
jgi:hypothetical protein